MTRFCLFPPSRLSSAKSKCAVDVAYKVATSDLGYPPEVRRSAGERVCLPLLRSCDLAALREFYLDHICEIMETLEASLPKVGVIVTCFLLEIT